MATPTSPDGDRRSVARRARERSPGRAISFGDAVLACHELGPRDEATGRAIIDMLGLAGEPTTPAPLNVGAARPSSPPRFGDARGPTRRSTTTPPPTVPSVRRPPATSATTVAATVTRLGRSDQPFQRPDWLDTVEPLGPLTEPTTTPDVKPLFGRVHRRGILTAATATLIEEGELDIDAIVATIAAGRPLRTLPRVLTQTTRRGAQILLDQGSGMAPFRNDQRQLVEALDHILGDEHFAVRRFVGCPSRGLLPRRPRPTPGRPLPLDPWKPPPSGTPIVVITDLGIGGPLLDDARATVREWVDFAHRTADANFTLIGLVPYEATRWPPRIARAMTLLHWSERTTASEVRHTMRDATRRLA